MFENRGIRLSTKSRSDGRNPNPRFSLKGTPQVEPGVELVISKTIGMDFVEGFECCPMVGFGISMKGKLIQRIAFEIIFGVFKGFIVHFFC